MTIYSIDLGIDPAATAGHLGDQLNPYPMQISLCSGDIEDGKFIPDRMSSWFQFLNDDQLLVRIFDLGDSAGKFELPPTVFDLNLFHLNGNNTVHLWTTEARFVRTEGADSLCFVDPDGGSYPCYQLVNAQDGPLLYPLQTDTRIKRLLTIKLETRVVNEIHPDGKSIRFKSDPELIVSPYGG